MHKLLDGIHRFYRDEFQTKKDLFKRLAKGQKPTVLFITCSDSRLDPNLLTRSDPGEIFIIRNVGNIIPPYGSQDVSVAAALAYALTVLHIEEIIVCGHSHCGAMHGVLNPATTKALPALTQWLGHADSTQQIMTEHYSHLKEDALLNVAIQENVLSQIANLKTHPLVASGLAHGKLTIYPWVYKFETGEVFAYSAEEGQFALLTGDMEPSNMMRRKLMSDI